VRDGLLDHYGAAQLSSRFILRTLHRPVNVQRRWHKSMESGTCLVARYLRK
jgi:hypothetical protein